jgi:erythromycin esterase
MAKTQFSTLDEWIAQTAIPFSLEQANTAIDRLVCSLGNSVELLGIGEALHGGEVFLELRNQLFQRLVNAHQFTAIAVESSFPRSWLAQEYVSGRGCNSYTDIRETGFSNGFGKLDANRELIEWMRAYNTAKAPEHSLAFYGFDSPTEMTHTDSPRALLTFVLDYLERVESDSGNKLRQQIEEQLGQDVTWENPAAMFDPSKSIGLTSDATAVRLTTEELLSELIIRRPEFVAKSDRDQFEAALHAAKHARSLLNYHAAIATTSEDRLARCLGLRDAMMAENLVYIVERERRRRPNNGRVFVFAHNSHLKLGHAEWQLGPNTLAWWPAGAQVKQVLGDRYAVIGTGLGTSPDNGIVEPEPATLEAHLIAAPGPLRFIPTQLAQSLPTEELAALSVRKTGWNQSYFPFTAASLTDYDWLAVADSSLYQRGGIPLPAKN